MSTSYSGDENSLKRNIEAWNDDKLKQYYTECRNAASFTPTLYGIPEDFKFAALIFVKTTMTVRGLLSE